MKIIQILPVFAFGDAIGNDTIALHSIIKQAGYDTHIYATAIDTRLQGDFCSLIQELPELEAEDVILYHLSTGSELNYQVAKYPCKLVVIYHNITPPEFYIPYSKLTALNCFDALDGAKYLADKAVYALADSEYNRQELLRMGYRCTVDVLPILIPFEDYRQTPDAKVIDTYQDGKTNIIFTGRVAPNKKHEDIIAGYVAYKKYFNPDSRLILVGGIEKTRPRYYEKLKRYVQALGVEDVIFTKQVSFREILGYYKVADIFLCLSEHEGFCVPLVEAMFFDVPIIAYDSTAIGDTLHGSGVLLEDKDPVLVAGMIQKVCQDKKLQKTIIDGQRKRLEDFGYDRVKEIFYRYLDEHMA